MGTKAKRKIRRQQVQLAEARACRERVNQLLSAAEKEISKERATCRILRQNLTNTMHGVHHELARYKFIDDIIAQALEHVGHPLVNVLKGTVRRGEREYPYMQIPLFNLPKLSADYNENCREAVQVLEYYLMQFQVHGTSPVIEMDIDGKRVAYACPAEWRKLSKPQRLALMQRYVTPHLLMIVENM